jgi:hypothetical protein
MLSLTRVVLLAGALLLAAAPTQAQKNCRKGKPCGNSCISINKTCHKASQPPVSTVRPSPGQQGSAASTEAAAPWVASSRGSTYYRNGCSAGNKLSAANRIYFKSEKEAEDAGYTRSRSKGC